MARRILVPYDGSLHAQCALVEAATRAADEDAETTLLAVAPHPIAIAGITPEQRAEAHADLCRELHALLNQARAEFAPRQHVETLVRSGDPADEILATIATGHYDLVVMGARSHGAFHSMREGAVAHAVRRSSRVPVVLTPAIPWRERRWMRQPHPPAIVKPAALA